MSVLEAMQAADAELVKQIDEQKEPEAEVVEKVEETEEVAEEETQDEDGEEQETADDTDDSDADEEEPEQEDDAKDLAKKGYKTRQKIKEAEERSDKLQKQLDDMQSTLQAAGITPQQLQLAQQQQLIQQQQQQKEADPEPDKDLDEIAHLQWQNRQLVSQREQDQQQMVSIQQQMQLQQATQEFKAYESQYQSNEFPQYSEAKTFLKTSYKTELKLQHPQATDAQLDQEISRQELILASNAVNGGMNPAEAVKRMAEARGFIAKQEKATPKKGKVNVSKMAQNQKRSANLINRSGDSKKDKLDAQQILDMSFDDRLKLKDREWTESEVAYDWAKA